MSKNQMWLTKARIVRLHKVYPSGTLIQGIPMDQQSYYDFNPRYVGGCGTYRLLTGTTWEMLYCVYSPGPGYREHLTYRLDVHQYITEVLQPRLGWKHISPQRLERIEKLLVGKKVTLTSNKWLSYGEIGDDFIPDGYNTWNEYFEEIFCDLE